MKTKLTIGDKVRVINKNMPLYGHDGKISERTTSSYEWRVNFKKFKDFFFYDTSDLQLIKPKTKWKYTRKKVDDSLIQIIEGIGNMTENDICEQLDMLRKDLLAKSEHTKDKSDKRPTLPEKIEGLPASLQFEMKGNILTTLANKLNELIDNQNQIISFLEEMK